MNRMRITKTTNMYKFEIGELVEKASGYKFRGRVVSRYEVDGGIRYDVQVDGTFAYEYVKKMFDGGLINSYEYSFLADAVMNCHGMIHIFAESQLTSAE